MGKSAKISVTGENATKRAFNAVEKGLARLTRKSLSASKAMARGFAGVFRRLINIKSILAGGAITAGLAMSVKQANTFAQSMAQVNTLLDDDNSIKSFTLAVRDLSAESGIAADELAGGLYQVLSAGVPADNAISFLAISAKAAAAGATDVTSSVDLLTTVLNAFKLESADASRVGDVLFQTVKLGKTTIEELSASLAQVAPLASSMGVDIEQVSGAIATLTKQGVPTANAVTQIRAALISVNDVMGDGWSKTMTLQEAFKSMSDKAGGSQNALKKMVGRIEGVNAILGLTGKNLSGAAKDFDQIKKSAGAMDAANAKVQQVRHWSRLFFAFKANVLAIGGAIDKGLAPLVDKLATKLRTMAQQGGALSNIAKAVGAFADNAAANMDRVFKKIADTAKGIAATILALSKASSRGETLEKMANVIKAALIDGGILAGQALIAVAPIIGALIGRAAKNILFEGPKRRRKIRDIAKAFGISEREAEIKLIKNEARRAGKDFADVGKSASNLDIALAELAMSVSDQRKAIDAAIDKFFASEKEKFKRDGDIKLEDILSGKLDPNKLDPNASVVDEFGKIVASVMSYQTAKQAQPERKTLTEQHLQKFGLSSRRHMKKTLVAGGQESRLGFALPWPLRSTRLEGQYENKALAGGKIPDPASITRQGIGMGELFDIKQLGGFEAKSELGTKNNPTHVVIEEAPL